MSKNPPSKDRAAEEVSRKSPAKARRAREAQAVCGEMRAAFLQDCVGRTLPVLFETEEDGRCTGHSDTYLLVAAPGEELRGLVKNVKITGVDGEKLVGTLL